MVCAMTSKQGLRDKGPLWLKLEMRVTIRRGSGAFSVPIETHRFQGSRHEVLDQRPLAQQTAQKLFALIRAKIEGQAALLR